MSKPDEPIERGQWWLRNDDSGGRLVINGRIESTSGNDWDVTLLPSGARMMKTAHFIVSNYERRE
jgi:hypothetical protein